MATEEDYQISVIAEPDALSGHTYSLAVAIHGLMIAVVENIQVSNIPRQSYVVRLVEGEVIPILAASIDSDRDMLNLESEGG